jgi:hypothetical protein
MEKLAYIFPFLFVGMFVLVAYMLSKRGWSDLVSKYRFPEDFSGERVGITSASINGVNYNNCLLLKYNEQGIYLKPIFVFRLFHAPVMIPWNEIKAVRDKKVLFVHFKELVIGDPAVALIQMKPITVEKLRYLKRN